MRRILLIEDDSQFRRVLAESLRGDYDVAAADTIREAEGELSRVRPELLLLDVEMPDGDGFRFCAKLRATADYQDLPIIFLTGHADVSEKVMGLTLGADDYLTKPFELAELRARIEVQLRKSDRLRAKTRELRVEDLLLNADHLSAAVVRPSGLELAIELTSLEFRILFHLASHENQVFSRPQLIESLWGNSAEIFDRAVDTQMSQLRKKLAESRMTVESVRGVGYRFALRKKAA